MTRSRESRRAAAKARETRSTRSRYLLPIVGAAVVLVAAVAALALTSGTGGGGASSPLPSASAAATGGSGVAGAPTITGTSLPKFTKTTGDPAVGMAIPTVEGTNFAGQPGSISDDGKPKVVLFLAHWCVHCQAEVPLIQAWLNEGNAPDGVELISVATGIDKSLPNYPPDEWLAREGWTVPVIVDPTGSAATAYGLSSYPFFVFVNADGTVKGRTAGELAVKDLETIIASLGR
jgi:thiol-disulfide isomerase/thioredoxin